jgi:hypothetical protein
MSVSISACFTGSSPGEGLTTPVGEILHKRLKRLIGHIPPASGETHHGLRPIARDLQTQPEIVKQLIDLRQLVFWDQADLF